jgi:small-conductance mechanosensitive channel
VSARGEPSGAVSGADLPRSSRDVDRAALLGTALAAVVALSFSGEGAWDWLGATAGIALLVVLAAFFRLPASGGLTPGLRGELAAVSVVAALAATLIVAPLLQAILTATTDAGRTCHASAAVAVGAVESDPTRQRGAELAASRGAAGVATATDALSRAARDEGRTVLGDCIGDLTSRWLWAPAAGMAAAGYTSAWWVVRRRHARASRG